MKKKVLFLMLIQISVSINAQIIADHSIVEEYELIPQQYIDEVKKMWLVVAGESHSAAYRDGLDMLEEINDRFAVNNTESGSPEPYTTIHLRSSRATWGDLNNESGWIYEYGQDDWGGGTIPNYIYDPFAVARTIAGITYCNSNNLTISAFGFGWCYDAGYALTHSYIKATKEYIDFCNNNNIETTVFFTTGAIDSDISYMADSDERAYINSLRWETIRDTVKKDATRILFDYADILSHNNNGEQQTQTWDGHTYPVIHPDNAVIGDLSDTGHIGAAGAIRLAKAMWWMLARIAGWDGFTTDIESNNISKHLQLSFERGADRVKIVINDKYLNGRIGLYDLNGMLLKSANAEENISFINTGNLTSGIYLIVLSKGGLKETAKIVLTK